MHLDLPDADCLLVVPPPAHVVWPSLGVHVLQACARERGFRVAVLYANALFAHHVGFQVYASLCDAPGDWLLGERLFARAAWDAPPFGFSTDHFWPLVDLHNARGTRATHEFPVPTYEGTEEWHGEVIRYSHDELARHEALATRLADEVGAAIAAKGYAAVGVTSAFDTTAAAIAILRRVKAGSPSTLTLLGGPNCEAEMARGLATIGAVPDVLFSGESEETFLAFLEDLQAGRAPGARIVDGRPCTDLDALPTPDMTEFFDQVRRFMPDVDPSTLWIQYETSRGCWWGARHHCTFCGLNGLGMGFRQRTPDKVIADLKALLAGAPTRLVAMADNIMPHPYHRTLLPRLPAEVPDVHVFWEQKANLDLRQVKGLHDSGSRSFQPGIESLDSDLLKLMRKGVLARQNLALLRYARIFSLTVKYNLLWAFPGDERASYERMVRLLPLITHLYPPNAVARLIVARFSPYYDHPDDHGVSDISPHPAYGEVLPPHVDPAAVAYHHDARFESGSLDSPDVMAALNEELRKWKARWHHAGGPPLLHARRVSPGRWLLADTRGFGPPQRWLNDAQARAVLLGGPHRKVPAGAWAIANGLAADVDGWCVALATASYEDLSAIEGEEATSDAVIRLGAAG